MGSNNVKDDRYLSPLFDVIASISHNKVKAMIWYGGDHSMEDYNPIEAIARLAKICVEAKPQSPLSHVMSLELKYNNEKGKKYKEAIKKHEKEQRYKEAMKKQEEEQRYKEAAKKHEEEQRYKEAMKKQQEEHSIPIANKELVEMPL